MNDDSKSIHEFEFNLICEYFSGLERQGPGSPEATLKALSFIDNLTDKSAIADIGCGTGGQTITLAQHTTGTITGTDLFPGFINQLNLNAQKKNLQKRVTGIVGSMDKLLFQDKELDLIWSEGAIYNVGFERGLNEWRKFLKPGGYIAVTDASWLSLNRPSEIEEFWQHAYPEIDTIANNVAKMQKAGYLPVAMFVLPEKCWIENYHVPQGAIRDAFLKKYAGNEAAEKFIAYQRREEALYYKYKAHYGYVFYIGKRVD